MPGRTPVEAREAFLAPLRRSLSCITNAQLFAPRKATGEVEALALSEDPLHLRSATVGDLRLMVGQQFRIIQSGETGRNWKVRTTAYRYQLLDNDRRELIAWHWHPATFLHAHVHVPAGPIRGGMHVPTGRVSLEAIIRFLLTELGVPARRDDFEATLAHSERNFIDYRSWHG